MSTLLPPALVAAAARVVEAGNAGGWRVATAESCTGGLVAAALTSIAGSSAVVERGFVTYSNQAKTEMLGVATPVLDRFGAVSAETAQAMAAGALAHSAADRAVAITGIAGPGGGSADKPVGLVHFWLARRDGNSHGACHIFTGDRDAVRLQAAVTALSLLRDG